MKGKLSGVIFRASKTVNGRKIYARDYNLRGFPIHIGGGNEKTTFRKEDRPKGK